MNTALPMLAWVLIGLGILLWFWGTIPLLLRRSIFFRLHALTVSDTIGSLLIVMGLLLLLAPTVRVLRWAKTCTMPRSPPRRSAVTSTSAPRAACSTT